jgi:hypothetical protein
MTRSISKGSHSEPTPERANKAVGVGHRLVGRRAVRELRTTLDHLERHHHFDRHRHCLRAFKLCCQAITAVRGGTSNLVSSYSDNPRVAYGSREISDRAVDAAELVAAVEAELPRDPVYQELYDQLVGEETGMLTDRPKTLAKYGRAFAWGKENGRDTQNKQSVAAGGMLAVCICIDVHHAVQKLKQRKAFSRVRIAPCTKNNEKNVHGFCGDSQETS